jgi:hypothetical protein
MNHINRRKAATLFVITALFASILTIPTATQAAATPAATSLGKIVFDYSHGQESGSGTVQALDAMLEANLTAMGFDVVWARGGINATILTGAVGFVAGSIYGASNGYLAAEVTAIANWYNAGNKFMWIGYDSDYTSAPDSGLCARYDLLFQTGNSRAAVHQRSSVWKRLLLSAVFFCCLKFY